MQSIAIVRVLLIGLGLALCAQVRAGEPPFSLSIQIQGEHGQLAVRDTSSHFHVVLLNTSSDPQRVWEWWNSWGWPTLSFELTDAAGKHWVAGRLKQMAWGRNFPSFDTIGTGEPFVIDVFFGDRRIWEGFPLEKKGELTKVQMRAVFEVPQSAESKEHKVWSGRVESNQVEVTFVRW